MGLLSLGVGIAIGYGIAVKPGKEKLDAGISKVRGTAQETWEREDVQDFVHKTSDTATKVSQDVSESARKAAAVASDAIKKGTEKATDAAAEAAEKAESAADAAEEKVSETAQAAEEKVKETAEEFKAPTTKTLPNGDVVSDPSQTTEREGHDWANEGGAKP